MLMLMIEAEAEAARPVMMNVRMEKRIVGTSRYGKRLRRS